MCVYSIRWPFSSRRELVKGGNSTAPIKLVVVVDRIHLVYIAQCTYYNLISNWLSYSVRYSWVFAFVSPPQPQQPLYTLPSSPLPLLTFNYLLPVNCLSHDFFTCTPPFLVFKMYPSYPLLYTATEHKIANLLVCVSVCMHACVSMGKQKQPQKHFYYELKLPNEFLGQIE